MGLAVAAVTSDDIETVRAAYVTLELTSAYVLVPLAVASLLTGLIQALGTSWGLFRHYWVIVKLVLNLFAATFLLLYLQTLSDLARLASASGADLAALSTPSPVVHAGAALLLLLVATTLSIFKPRGMTRFGQRRAQKAGGEV